MLHFFFFFCSRQGWIDNFNGPSGLAVAVSVCVLLFVCCGCYSALLCGFIVGLPCMLLFYCLFVVVVLVAVVVVVVFFTELLN